MDIILDIGKMKILKAQFQLKWLILERILYDYPSLFKSILLIIKIIDPKKTVNMFIFHAIS